MFYLGKLLQALGIADVGFAVFKGIFWHIAMAEEIVLTLIGVTVFWLGRVLESKAA
jgi:spore maturation protein SpmA